MCLQGAALLRGLLERGSTVKGDAAAEASFASDVSSLSPRLEKPQVADIVEAIAQHGAASKKSLSA